MPLRLEDYYRKLEKMMAEGEALVAARDPANESEVKRRMADSALVMASYQLFVHREVFVPMLDGADAARRARINEIKVECIALTEDLRFNIRDFVAGARDAPIDWDAVVPKVAWYNSRVRAHIASVRTLLSPLLSDADHARLRARHTAPVGVQAI